MSNKRIINCAITGSIHTPSMSPYLPITPKEIADSALEAAGAGAAAVHIHSRNPKTGQPVTDISIFGEIIERIREKNDDVIICVTTGGGLGMKVEDRASVVPALKPELASLNAGSINYGLFTIPEKKREWKFDWEVPYLTNTKDLIFQNTFGDLEKLIEIFDDNGTKPELECYDIGHIYNVKFLQERGIIKSKPYLQFVLGVKGGIDATLYDLMNLKQTADRVLGVDQYEWSAFGAGRMEYPICVTNLLLGGHVRVGLEDNLNISRGIKAKSNKEMVDKMVRFMTDLDYEVATPTEAREMLGIIKK